MPINNIVGPPVEGNDFFGRKKLIQLAWNYLKNKNNLVFAAPRRVGKTSVGKKLITKAKNEGWRAFEINLEEVKSEEGFIRLMVETLESQKWWDKFLKKSGNSIQGILERLKTKIGYGGVDVTIEWQNIKDDVYEDLKKVLDHSQDTLIMIDELTVLLSILVNSDPKQGTKNAEYLLNWLRNLRQVSGSNIRWIFCSSVGIANFCNIHGLSYTLNDVGDFEIGAYERSVAIELLTRLSKNDGNTFPVEIIDYILDEKINWHLPYFLQLIYFNIHKNLMIDEVELSKNGVDRAFDQLCVQNQLDTWDERLNHYGNLEKTARRILNHICHPASGTKRERLVDKIISLHDNDIDDTNLALGRALKMLINDGYLVKTSEDLYIFRSAVIQAYWFNKFIA